jgi:hypothetical protein
MFSVRPIVRSRKLEVTFLILAAVVGIEMGAFCVISWYLKDPRFDPNLLFLPLL